MNGMRAFTFHNLGRVLLTGFKMGLVTALFYGLAFSIVAIPRASGQIIASLSLEEGMLATLFANAANIYLLAIEFAFGMGLIAAFVCALTFGIVYLLVLAFKADTPRQRTWIGLEVSFIMVVILHLILWPVEGIPHAMLFRSIGAYLFWLGAPCLIYVILSTWTSARSFSPQKVRAVRRLHGMG